MKPMIVTRRLWEGFCSIGRGKSYRTFTFISEAREYALERGRNIRVVYK